MTDPTPDVAHVTITTTTDGAVDHVHVSGELDAVSAPVVLADLQEVGRRSPSPVVVHLGEVTFIDSCGVQVLVDARHELGESASGLWLGSLSPAVQRLLEITKLIDEFRTWPDPTAGDAR